MGAWNHFVWGWVEGGGGFFVFASFLLIVCHVCRLLRFLSGIICHLPFPFFLSFSTSFLSFIPFFGLTYNGCLFKNELFFITLDVE